VRDLEPIDAELDYSRRCGGLHANTGQPGGRQIDDELLDERAAGEN
jgi:hypothetical protein